MFLEKVAMFIGLLFVVLVAAFGILATNLMSVLDKAQEIAILKAMGSSDRRIARVFMLEGMIVGVHSRDNDLVVNATRTKQLTNFRVSGKEDAIKITPPIECTLEYGVEFIEDDELVEITPKSIRLRKRHLKEHERKRASRESA